MVETFSIAALWVAVAANFASLAMNIRTRRRMVALMARTQDSRRRLEESIERIETLIHQHPNHGDA